MLTGVQQKKLNEALLAGFSNQTELQMLARYAGLDWSEIPTSGSLREITFHVVQSADREARLDELLARAVEERPNNAALVAIVNEVRSELAASSASTEASRRNAPEWSPEDFPEDRTDAVPTHLDRPSSHDRLERHALAEVLADRLRRLRGEDTEHPRRQSATGEAVLVHLSAPWGAGKTSLLYLLRNELEEPRDTRLAPWVSVLFDAWQHQRLAPPWWWLLSAIRREGAAGCRRRGLWAFAWFVIRDYRWRVWNARSAWIAGLLVACLAALIAVTDGFGLANSSLNGLQAAVTAVTAIIALGLTIWGLFRGLARWLAFGGSPPGARALQRVHDPLQASQRRFASLIDSLGAPAVVLVDNLDRCRADFVVELLEGIQTLFLDRPVTYVIAADRDWLCRCYEKVYEDFGAAVGDAGRPLGHLFLEKTFQVSLEIPPVGEDTLSRYWQGLIRGRSDDAPSDDTREFDSAARARFEGLTTFAEVIGALETAPSSDAETDAWRRAAMRRLNSPDLEAGLQHALEPFASLVEPNPRSMKRLVNAYGVERALRVRLGAPLTSVDRAKNVLWTIVRLRWPLLAEYLSRHPEHADILAGGASLTDFDPVPDTLRPLFADIDVRRVFTGEGIGPPLDAEGVRQFLHWGRAPSSVGA